MVKYDKRLTQHLLHLIENDDFETAYYILTTQYDKVNVNAKTSSGDYMSTLLSYAACEHSLGLPTRIYGFQCLQVIMDRNLFVVNQIAGDGGGVLHCALASASSSWVDHLNGFESNEFEEIEETHDGHSYSDHNQDDEDSDSDQEQILDPSFLNELKMKASSIGKNTNDIFHNITSAEVTACTVLLLLSKNADVSLRLIQQHAKNLGSDSEDVDNCNDHEEEDAIFSRQSINENWTPLMFAIEWCILTCVKLQRRANIVDHLALPTLIVLLFMMEGADPTDLGNSSNALHIISSVSFFLSQCHIQGKELEHSIVSLYQRSLTIFELDLDKNVQSSIIAHLNVTEDKDDSYYDILSNIIRCNRQNISLDMTLSKEQNLAIRVFSDDISGAHEVLRANFENVSDDTTAQEEVFRCWSNTSYGQLFPILKSVWPVSDSVEQKSVFEMTAYLFLEGALRWLIELNQTNLTNETIRKCAISVFQNFPSRMNSDNMKHDHRKEQEGIISFLLGDESNISTHQKQYILDRLLVESCSGKTWTLYSPDITWMLVKYGADPNIVSISDNIQDDLKPVHLIAANCRGSMGVEKLSCLLDENLIRHPHQKANLLARTSSPEQKLAVDIALEKCNFQVSFRLLEVQGKDFIRNDIHTLEYANLVAKTAIQNDSYDMLTDVLMTIEKCTIDTNELAKSLGQIIILALDGRSGFSKSSDHDLMHLIGDIKELCKRHQIRNLSSWARDHISGYNPLHLLIRTHDDRPSRRIHLIRPLCDLLTDDANDSISQPCANSFGGYTPLHLAYSLKCKMCIDTLMDFGADEYSKDAQGKLPSDLSHIHISD